MTPQYSIKRAIIHSIIGALFYASFPAIAQQTLNELKAETQRINAENKIFREQLRQKRAEQKKAKEAEEFEKYIQRLNRARERNNKLREQLEKAPGPKLSV